MDRLVIALKFDIETDGFKPGFFVTESNILDTWSMGEAPLFLGVTSVIDLGCLLRDLFFLIAKESLVFKLTDDSILYSSFSFDVSSMTSAERY